MIQDYAPIELNENTPEPKENHSYYLVAVEYNGVTDYKLLYFESLLWFGIGSHGPVAWPTVRELLLSDIAGVDGTVTIQSLAAHDAEVRDKALTLTDEEQHVAADELAVAYRSNGTTYRDVLRITLEAIREHRMGLHDDARTDIEEES